MNSKLYKLKDLAILKYGKNQKKVESPDGTIPIYGTGGLMGFSIKPLYDKPSVLIGRKGTIDKIHYVEDPFWTVDTLFYTEINESLVLPKYLYYVLSKINFSKYNEGTSIPSLRTETLNEIELNIVPLEKQKEIINLIKPLEDKISVDKKINDYLSDIIETLASRMVSINDKESIQSKKYILSDVADLISGYAYKSSELVDQSETALVTIKNFNRTGGFKEDGFKGLNISGNVKNEQIVKKHDLLIACTDLTQNAEIIGNVELLLDECDFDQLVISTDLCKIKSKNEAIDNYILSAILSSRKFKEYALGNTNGTTVLHLSKKSIPKYEFYLPDDTDLVRDYASIFKLLYNYKSNNYQKIRYLSSLRDLLINNLIQ